MKYELVSEVPSLDLEDFLSGDPEIKNKFVADLGGAFNTIGFVAIKNHGLTEEMRLKLYEVVKRFFTLP